MDSLDQFIKRCATTLHEAARQRAVSRRHAKSRESEIKVKLDQIYDRILLHFPLTERSSRPDLSNAAFRRLRDAEAAHRTQLLLTVVAMSGVGKDEPESDLNF